MFKGVTMEVFERSTFGGIQTLSINESTDSTETTTVFPEIPSSFKEMSDLSRNCVIAYCILFVTAAAGNVTVFYSVIKKLNRCKSRISLLILHLSIADLLVTFSAMPMEIIWRITIQWYGGDLLCKFCQFFRAFGLYLSSMIVICVSLDRYFAIIYPMKLVGAAKRVNVTLACAWISAIVFALPQAVIFKVMPHPDYPSFHQCVTETFLRSNLEQELVYNVFSVTILYFIPLSVILYTYARILCKIFQKSKASTESPIEGNHHVTVSFMDKKLQSSADQQIAANVEKAKCSNSSRLSTMVEEALKVDDHHPSSPSPVDPQPSSGTIKLHLRKSTGGGLMMARARVRTLRLTCVIVITFIFCWTPYVVMTLWYMIDRDGAKDVDARVQEGLFIMAVSNSVVNPLIYGTYGSDCRAPGVKNCYKSHCCKNKNCSPNRPLYHRRSTIGTLATSTGITHACDM